MCTVDGVFDAASRYDDGLDEEETGVKFYCSEVILISTLLLTPMFRKVHQAYDVIILW